ncbi:hypothetical protein EX30DRAFT_386820 [Ascodesmis nigricans]|uniref:Uncharacterized protein n=1 Tax=Ascodesmis nigricans TaxID=341454 RepID=A0A4V3SJ41_9PEZI|nr:hypothetical protein EX30DRAFT_386820 [Ascodesmis nigricans]
MVCVSQNPPTRIHTDTHTATIPTNPHSPTLPHILVLQQLSFTMTSISHHHHHHHHHHHRWPGILPATLPFLLLCAVPEPELDQSHGRSKCIHSLAHRAEIRPPGRGGAAPASCAVRRLSWTGSRSSPLAPAVILPILPPTELLSSRGTIFAPLFLRAIHPPLPHVCLFPSGTELNCM